MGARKQHDGQELARVAKSVLPRRSRNLKGVKKASALLISSLRLTCREYVYFIGFPLSVPTPDSLRLKGWTFLPSQAHRQESRGDIAVPPVFLPDPPATFGSHVRATERTRLARQTWHCRQDYFLSRKVGLRGVIRKRERASPRFWMNASEL